MELRHMKQSVLFTLTLSVLLTAATAYAHDGRRYEVKILDNQLVAHGYISGVSPSDDGGGLVRDYYNAIHGHWSNIPGPTTVATATLPGYDILDEADALIGHNLQWQVTGGWKWTTPTMMGPYTETALDPADVMSITLSPDTVSTSSPGSLTLISNFDGTNGLDLDLTYSIGLEPVGVLYVIESILTTDAPGVLDSETIYTVLSPDGANMAERLHHHALNLESQLGTPIPEPVSLVTLAAGSLLVLTRRR